MNWKSTAAVSGATPRYTGADAPVVPGQSLPVASIDIENQAARLQTRVRSELDYSSPKRNPFRFTVRPVPAERTARPTDTNIAPAASMPEPIPFRLSGMATDVVDGQPQRTAILTTATDVVFAKEGERVGSYVVSGIDDMGVDLTGPDGTGQRLALTP